MTKKEKRKKKSDYYSKEQRDRVEHIRELKELAGRLPIPPPGKFHEKKNNPRKNRHNEKEDLRQQINEYNYSKKN